MRKILKTVVQSPHCLDQQTNDTDIILEKETTFREVPSDNDNVTIYSNVYGNEVDTVIGVARGGHGRAFALPSHNFALPSKPPFYYI